MSRKSLHHAADLEEIIDRISKLTPETVRRWGKMDVCEMLHHCRLVLEIPAGKVVLPRKNMFVRLIGICAKREMAIFNNGIPRNMPTFEVIRCTDAGDFESEKTALLNALEEYCQLAQENTLPESHELFGKLTRDQWSFLEYKHLHHHLKQFNV